MNTQHATIQDPKFFEGGRAVFTIHNNQGKHFTYRIGRRTPDQPFFVSLLTGPDNTSSFTYIGIYNPLFGNVRLTAKSRLSEDSLAIKVLKWGIGLVRNSKKIPEGYGIHHEGKCARCGRKLTTPESVSNGIGPECIKMMS